MKFFVSVTEKLSKTVSSLRAFSAKRNLTEAKAVDTDSELVSLLSLPNEDEGTIVEVARPVEQGMRGANLQNPDAFEINEQEEATTTQIHDVGDSHYEVYHTTCGCCDYCEDSQDPVRGSLTHGTVFWHAEGEESETLVDILWDVSDNDSETSAKVLWDADYHETEVQVEALWDVDYQESVGQKPWSAVWGRNW